MINNFKNRNPKLFFQLLTLSLSSAFIFGISLYRANKSVLVFSIYEELMPYLHRISHVGRLKENNNYTDGRSTKYGSNIFKYLLSFSIFKGETKEAKLLPVLKINLPYEDMNIIRKDRYKSIKRGYLTNPRWADGKISHKGETVKAKFRLKGDLKQHWLGNKRFSLRIRTKSSNGLDKPSILGMRTFSLHKLSTREYPYENIFQEILKELKFHSIPHKVVKVFVNGENWGLMDMQEHFSTQLLEKNRMRDSLIFTFSNDARFVYEREVEEPISQQFYWLNNPRLFFKLTGNSLKNLNIYEKKQYSYIQSILREPNYQEKLFSQRHLRDASDLLNLWGDFHPIALTNSKFYLNPFTLKLEPLMADQGEFIANKYGFKDGINLYTNGFLKVNSYKNSGNSEFKKLIVNKLSTYEPSYKLSEEIFPQNPSLSINSVQKNLYQTKINNFKKSKYKNYPEYSDNIECGNKNLSIPSTYPAIQAKYTKNELQIIPLICGEFKFIEANICDSYLPLNSYIKPKNISIYQPKIIMFKNKKLLATLDKNLNCLQNKNFLSYYFNGTLKNTTIEPIVKTGSDINPLIDNYSKPKFIKNIDKDKFLISSGVWDIKKPIFIEGEIIINEGANLRFSPESFMIIKGNIIINGSKDKPVIMKGINENSSWKGLYVFNEEKEKKYSKLKSLRVSNTKNTQIGILNLTGGITFYNTNIFIDDLEIKNSSSEDAINIVKGDINILKLHIIGSKSDGLDCDFCRGNIDNLELHNIGGDGLDIAGSQINATINKASNIKDKVVSIGEASLANILISNVTNSYLGAAIKDGSKANLKLNNVQTNGPLAMSYIKKDFYESQTIANISYDEKLFQNNQDKFLADKKTLMKINNKEVMRTNINVKNLYEFGPMKKLK